MILTRLPRTNPTRLSFHGLVFRGLDCLSAMAMAMALVWTFSLVGCQHAGIGKAPAYDPVTMDRPSFDASHPPRIVETVFQVADAGLNAIVYEAQGPGPHPTVILLHGFPGNEKNLDLAQAIRRAGWNVVFFHYRGSWGSGGAFSFVHVIEDVASVVSAISRPEFARAHRIDSSRLAVVGHSMGGFAALVSAGELEALDCVVSLAGANLGGLARRLADAPDQAAGFAASLDGWSGPIRGLSGQALVAEIDAHRHRFDTTSHASELARKPVLLIAGARDVVTPVTLHHAPLADALQAAGAASLQTELYVDGDHSFSGQRIAVGHRVTRWLADVCEMTD